MSDSNTAESDDEEETSQYEVSHVFTNFQGVPTDTESVVVPAANEAEAIDIAKDQFNNEIEDEESIEVMEY